MSNFVRSFKKFQNNKRKESLVVENKKSEVVNEAVAERDNKFIVSGISIPQSLVTGYASKVKKDSGKDVFHDYSKKELAEVLVNYIIDKHGDAEQIPISAIYGGEDDMGGQVGDVSTEEDPLDVNDDGFSQEEGNEDNEFPSDENIDMDDTDTTEEEELFDGGNDEDFESLDNVGEEGDDDIENEEDEDEVDDLPDGDPITSDDFEENDFEEEEERPRRKRRRFEEDEENDEF